MKRLFKKGLSLLLAVLMVVSMLPTSAWAVTFADGEDSGHEETPVWDVGENGDLRAHSSGSSATVRDLYADAEETEEPVPTDDPGPAGDLNAAEFTAVRPGDPSGSGVLLEADVSGPDHLTFLIVPKFKKTTSGNTPARNYDNALNANTLYSTAGGGSTSNVTNAMGPTGFPYAYFSTATTADAYSWGGVTVNWDGTLTGSKGSNTSYTESLQVLSSADKITPTALEAWLAGLSNTTLYDQSGNVLWAKDASGNVTTPAAALPFRIYAIASGQSAAVDISIPTAAGPTLVFGPINPVEANVPATNPGTAPAAPGDWDADSWGTVGDNWDTILATTPGVVFATVELINPGSVDAENVKVSLANTSIFADLYGNDEGWGNEDAPFPKKIATTDHIQPVAADGTDLSTTGVTIPAGSSITIQLKLKRELIYAYDSSDPTVYIDEYINYTLNAKGNNTSQAETAIPDGADNSASVRSVHEDAPFEITVHSYKGADGGAYDPDNLATSGQLKLVRADDHSVTGNLKWDAANGHYVPADGFDHGGRGWQVCLNGHLSSKVLMASVVGDANKDTIYAYEVSATTAGLTPAGTVSFTNNSTLSSTYRAGNLYPAGATLTATAPNSADPAFTKWVAASGYPNALGAVSNPNQRENVTITVPTPTVGDEANFNGNVVLIANYGGNFDAEITVTTNGAAASTTAATVGEVYLVPEGGKPDDAGAVKLERDATTLSKFTTGTNKPIAKKNYEIWVDGRPTYDSKGVKAVVTANADRSVSKTVNVVGVQVQYSGGSHNSTVGMESVVKATNGIHYFPQFGTYTIDVHANGADTLASMTVRKTGLDTTPPFSTDIWTDTDATDAPKNIELNGRNSATITAVFKANDVLVELTLHSAADDGNATDQTVVLVNTADDTKTVTLVDDGADGVDATAGDGIYTAWVPVGVKYYIQVNGVEETTNATISSAGDPREVEPTIAGATGPDTRKTFKITTEVYYPYTVTDPDDGSMGTVTNPTGVDTLGGINVEYFVQGAKLDMTAVPAVNHKLASVEVMECDDGTTVGAGTGKTIGPDPGNSVSVYVIPQTSGFVLYQFNFENAATGGDVTVDVKLDNANDTTAHTVYLWEKDAAAADADNVKPGDAGSGAIALTQGADHTGDTPAGTDDRHLYTKAAVPAGTYFVWVDGVCITNAALSSGGAAIASIEVTDGGTHAAQVDYYTVTATAGTGVSSVTPSASTVLKGTTGVTITGVAQDYFGAPITWTKTSGADINSGSSTLTITLKAIEAPTAYKLDLTQLTTTVTYYGNSHGTITPNGGTAGTSHAITVDQGSNHTVGGTANSFTLTPASGWTFDKWNTANDGSGTDYDNGDTLAVAASAVDLYAIWKENTAKVTIKLDNGTYTAFSGTVTLRNGSTTLTAKSGSGSGVYNFGELATGTTYNIYIDGTDTTKTVTTVDGDEATGEVQYYTLKLAVSGSGFVAFGTSAPTSGTSATGYYRDGTTANIAAAPDTNQTFTGWTGGTAGSYGTGASTDIQTYTVTKAETLTANFAQGTFTGTVKVTWDGAAPTGSTSATVRVNNTDYTVDATHTSVSIPNLVQGTSYPITVDGHATGMSLTTADNSKTVEYISAVAATDGNGTVTAAATGYTSAEATTASATLWVLKGTKVTWSQTPATYYKFKQWEDALADGDVTTDVTAQEINSRTIRKGIFERKTSEVEITLKRTPVGGAAANYDTTGTVKLGTSAYTATLSNAGHTLTIHSVPQDGTTYKLMWNDVDSLATVTLGDDTDGGTVKGTIDFYEMQAISDGYGTATVTSGSSTQSTANATPASITVLKGSNVSWSTSNTVANYTFDHWDTNTTTDPSVTGAAAAAAHTAHFTRESFNAKLKITLNGVALDNTSTDITAVTNDTGKAPAYNGTDGWVSSGIPSNGTSSITWTVTDANGLTHTVTDSAPLNKDDTDEITLNLYTVTIQNGVGGNASTANDASFTVDPGTGAVAKTKVYLSASRNTATVNTNQKAKYSVSGWLGKAGTSAPTLGASDTLTAAKGGSVSGTTFTLGTTTTLTGGAGLYIQPTYTFEATVKTVRGTTETAPGGDVVLKASTGGTDETLSSFDGSEDVTGLIPGVTYTVWVNGFATTHTVTAPGTVSVPLAQISTAKNPTTVGTAYIQIGSSVTGTDTSIYVPKGASTGSGSASVALAAAATGDYKLATTVWTGATATATFGSAGTGNSGLNLANQTDDLTVTANFVKKTGDIVVAAKLDTDSTAHTFPDGTKITLVPTGATLGADTSKEKTQTVSGTSTGSVTFSNLEHDSTNGWDIYVGTTLINSGTNVTVTGDDGSSVTKNAMYFTVKVKSGGHGNASVSDGTNTASTDYAATTPVLEKSIVVLEQTSVTWTVGAAETNFAFTHWDTTTTDTATTKTATITTKDQSHTANFSKTKYTATLDLELDDADVTAISTDVTAVTLEPDAGNTAANEPSLLAAYNPTSGKWEVNDLPNAHKYTWKVVTSSNNNVTSSQVTQTAADKTIDLFKVSVVTGSDIPAGSTAPKIKGVTTVVEPASATALTLDPSTKNGFTCTGWVQHPDADLPTGLTATTTGLTIDSTYAGTTDGITIKPTFTFQVPVELQYAVDNSPVPGQTVTVKLADGSAATGVTVDVTHAEGGSGTTDTDGKFMISGMDPDETYTIWVNGFESELALDNTKASTSVAQVVKLHKITAVAKPSAAGTPKVNNAAEVYVPNKAAITTNAPTVTVDAGTATSGYRWLTESGETLWTKPSTDTTTGITTATSTSTTITSASVEADIVVEANAIKQWTVNVVNQTTPHDGGTLNAPTITSGTGTIGTLTDGNYPNNIVDDNGVINVTAAAKDDFTASWSVAKPDGTALTGKIDAANGGDVTVDQDMTITVSWTANEYQYIFDPNTGFFATGDGADPDLNATTGMVERTATVGTVIAKPDDPTKTAAQGADRNYAFAGWYDDPDAGEGNKITFDATHPTMPSKPTNGKVTVYAHWTPLYTITYDANDHGTINAQPTDQIDQPEGQYPAKSFTLISADTGDTFSSAGLYTEDDGTYWMFKGWDPDPDATAATYQPGDNVTLPDPATEDVTLYAIWESQVEVKLGAAADAKSNAGNAPAASTVSATLDNITRTSGHSNAGKFVKAGTAVPITNLTVPSGYIFAYWTASDATGAFDATKNDKVKDAIFTPTANTVLTPHYWKAPTLSGTDGYHLNFAKDAAMTDAKWSTAENKKATNSLPAYTWTQNDAELPTTEEFQIEQTTGTWTPLRVGASAGANVDVVKTVSGNTVTYTIQESYLKTLSVPDGQTVADYPVRVVSKTPDYNDPAKPNAEDTIKESKLQIVVTPDPLIEVNILAKGRTQKTQTAKVGDGTGTYDNVHYLDHKETAIVSTNKLTYTWYISKNHTDYPAQHSYTDTVAGPSATATTTATTNATTDALAKGKVIQGPSTDDTVPVNKAEYKGKWIYAVVAANNTGYGAVITNAIAVDYDAKIAVNQDNAPVPGNKANGYRVFLVPATAPADLAISAEGNLTGTGVVSTTNDGTDNVYATADSELTGGVTYYAYVNKVEGDFTQYEKTSVSVSTQVETDQIINFYSVNAEGTDKLNKTDSKGDDVGESFGASDAQLPDIGFTTDKTGGGTITVPKGYGVLKGSKVTAKTDNKDWTQDYKVNWGVTTTEPTGAAPLTYTTVTNQTKDAAFATGTGERTISQKTWIGAQLEQRVYSVVGNIWATGTTKTAGILTSGAGNVPTLTYGTYRFDGTVSGSGANAGAHKQTVTFTVPKSGVTGAIAGQYVLSAKPKTSPKTTILMLAEGGHDITAAGLTDTTVLTWGKLGGTNNDTLANITGDTTNTNPAFTIVVAASTYVLDLAETSEGTDNKTAHGSTDGAATTQPVASGGAVATRAFSEDYAARVNTAKAYTFAVTNNGNTTLKVSLKVKKGTTDVYGTGVTGSGILTDADGDGTYEDANGMTFAGLQTSFNLAPGATSSAITVTIPSPLGVKDVANYDFEFTSVQKDIDPTVYGPSVTYKLTEAVKPWKITGISAKAADAGAGYDYVADETALVLKNDAETKTLTGKTAIQAQGIDLTTAPEVEYTWWRGPYGASQPDVTAAFDAVNGVFTDANYAPADGDNGDGTYTYHTNDQGKAVYVVAKFKGTTATRTGNVVRSAFDFPAKVAVPYDMKIQIKENSAPVKDANKGNYDLYLVPTGAVAALDWTPANLAAQGIITGAHDATGGADQGKWAVTGLAPGTEYKIYTNAVGSDHTAANRKDSGETVKLSDFLDGVDKIVTYHNVVIQNTVADNSPYTIDNSDNQFVNTADGTTTTIGADSGALVKPSASFGGVTVATSASSADRWVQKGTTIALSYADWNRDYKLEWSNAASGTVTGDPTGAVSSSATVNGADTTVETKLTLNTYTVTMEVEGTGSLDWVTLTDGDHAFTTKATDTTDTSNKLYHATDTKPSAGTAFGADSYTFTVPQGTYTITASTASGTNIDYYKIPITDTTEIPKDEINNGSHNLAVTDNSKNFLIKLSAQGQFMQVEDDRTSSNATNRKVGTASVALVTDDTGTSVKKNDDTAGSTITLKLGYNAPVDVMVKASNTSPYSADNNLYKVTWAPAATGNSDKITATVPDYLAAKPTLYAVNTGDTPAVETNFAQVKLTVDTGLGVGTHTFTADVSFEDKTPTADYTPKVTYTLTVVVEPAAFTDVSISKVNASTADDADIGAAMVPFGVDLKPYQYTTTAPNLFNISGAIADGTDYAYTWYATPATVTSFTGTWADGVFTPPGNASALADTDNVLKAGTIANHPGEKLWLVIAATNTDATTRKVTSYAVSDPVSVGFQPKVQVTVDGSRVTTDTDDVTGTQAARYAVTFNDGTTDYVGVWDGTLDAFVPATVAAGVTTKQSFASGTSLTVKVSPVADKMADSDLVTLTGATLTGAAPVATAPYFTVNAVATKAFAGISGLGEDFTDNGTDKLTGPAVSFTYGGTAIAGGTPVLSGEDIVAKTADWSQDYKLTWYTRMDGAATVPNRDDAYEGTNHTMTADAGQVDHTSASGTGKTVTVGNKLYVGGRLDQNTYTIKATVKGTGTLSEVTLDQMDGGATSRRSYAFTNAATDDKVSTNASGNSLSKDQYVTFTVVKGGFDLAATPGTGTVISSMVWEETGDTVNDGAPLTGKTVAATGDGKEYAVTINLTATELKLKVEDDGGKDAESDPFTVDHVTNGVERYFNYIRRQKANAANPDTYEYELTLTNPGNKDLYAAMDVYYFADPSVLSGANYYDTVGNWEDVTSGGTTTPAVNTPIFSADATTTAQNLDINGITVLELSELMATGSKVAKDSGTQKVGKLTLGTDTWVKDDGAFVFRFKGTTGTASDQPVYVYYVLDLTVDQLPIAKVETQVNGAAFTGMPGVGDKLQATGYDATNNESLKNVKVYVDDAKTEKTADEANLEAYDVHFAWVKVTKDAGLAKANLSVAHDGTHDGQLVTTKGSVVSQSEEYVLQDGDQDSDFYLVAFAPNYTGNETNATDMVIANVIQAKRTVGVQVSLDGTTQPASGTVDPGYTVYFVEGTTIDVANADNGTSGTWSTTWNGAKKVYQAPVDMTKTYHVFAATTKGGTTFVDTGLTVGKDVTTTPVVPYWNVAHTANVAVVNGAATGFKSYLPNGTATSDNAIQGALSVKVSTAKNGTTYEAATLAASVPVLEGMNVQVTVDGTKDNNNATAKESWEDKSDYHTLTTTGWNKDDTATSGSKIPYGAAIVSGDIPVNGRKSFSATLAPVLFEVTFKVMDVSDPAAVNPPTITGATLSRDTAKEPGVPSSFAVTGALGAQSGGDGDTVTFTNVPAGDMVISAAEGNKTMVVGYTWNDADAEPVAAGNVVHVTTDASKNKNEGNLIEILEATNMIRWEHNFDKTNGKVLPDDGFAQSNVLAKVDGRPGEPDLALRTGYNATDDTLEYKVRVYNAGTSGLEDFRIDASGVPTGVLTYSSLSSVKHYNADGTELPTTANVAVGGFTLGAGECVEFTITIPVGQEAQDDYYESVFKAKTSNEGNLGGGDYKPSYQVKGNIGFTEGKAQVLYGHDAFQSNTDLALTWDGGATKPSFKYEILALSGADADADAAVLALINEKLELTGANAVTALDAKPDWVTLNDTTGEITFTAGEHATGVNVEVKGTPASFAAYDDAANGHKVDNEVVLYVKATEQLTGGAEGESFVTTYTVDVEPGQLAIQGPAFDPKNPEDATKRPYGGTDVNKADFQYSKVVNQATAPLDVIPAATNPAVNTGAGNDPSQEKPTNGKVFVNDGTNDVHTATWTVSPTKYVSEVATDYAFTVTYKPENTAEKWNYKPATWAQEITAEAPPQYTVHYDWNTHTPDGKTLPADDIVDPKVDPNHKVSSVLTVGTDYKDVSGTDGLYWNFKGWNTAADGSGDAYAPNATFQPTANVTLYAQWEAKMLNVTYKYNGNGTPDKTIPNAVQKGGSYTVAEADPTWSGRTFQGWTVTGGTPSANPLKTGGKVNAVTTNVVLTAQWERDRSKIIYDWNYTGSAKVTNTGNTGERDTAVPNTAPARTGYTWDGKWYEEKECTTQVTNFIFPATKGGDVTYYAKWTRDQSKIAFALDGGTLEGYPQTYEGNTSEALEAAKFPAAAPTKDGYTFTGWKGDDGKTYTAAALPNFPATKGATLTITAQWQRDQSYIIFDLDGGNIDGETDNLKKNGPTGTLLARLNFPETPVREGYAFEYWLGEDAKIYSVDDRPSFPDNKDGELIVTAQWRKLVQGLKFSDERSNDAAVNDAAGKITLVDPDATLTAPDLKKAFPPARKVERTGEYVVYLDTEPRYTVALHSVGDPVYNVSVTATDARGVKYTDLPVNVASFASTDDTQVITLDLEALSGKLWAGEHHILLTATGYTTEVEGQQNADTAVTATYELTFEIKKKPIPQANLIPDPTDPTDPDKAKVIGEGGQDLRKPDSKGNTPVDKPTITKTPTDPKPGETYEIKTTLEPDPNYTFEPSNDPADPGKTPNYTMDGKGDKDWPEGDKDLVVTVKPEAPGADVTYVVTKRQPLITIGAHLVAANSDAMVMSAFTTLIGQELRAYRAQSDDTEKYPRTGTTYGTDWWWSMGDTPGAVLDIQPGTTADGKEVKAPVFEYNKTYVLTVRLDPDEVNYRFVDFKDMTATFDQFNTNLKRDLTRQANAAALKTSTEGFTILVDDNGNYYLRTYYLAKKPSGGGGGGGGGTTCPSQVTYLLGLYGTTKDPVMEMVSGTKATKVPNVTAITGYKFLGWSLAGPIGDPDKDATRTLVDPKEVPIEGDTTFYAVYQPLYNHGRPFHEHYVIGYPNGNFGPSDNINRASVATIIARAVLPNFVEGADYGNPGNYSDVSGHWASSAIAYCTRYGVFKGYEDGTFRPDQPISRQELVLTLARLSGMQEGTAPFSDLNEAGDWAKGGIYTAYVKGWVNGYTDGTFRPTNPIARDETVKIFNAYLYRGVNAEGLSSLTEYVHSGVASNNTENGTSEYMTWPDVPKEQWAYYEIIEAANDHEYAPDETKKAGYTVPEVWTKCWIDEKWRYHDDANDGGPAAVTMALLRKYGVIA